MRLRLTRPRISPLTVPLAAVLAGFVQQALTGPALGAAAEEFRCQFGAAVRRVQLQIANDADRLPCQVLYWRNARSGDPPQVIWEAEHELDFCLAKTEDLVQRLERAGWRCTPPEGTEPAAAPSGAEDLAAARASRSAAPRATARDLLEEVLTRDLRRLNQLSPSNTGRFTSERAWFGDLDRDGLNDAVILLTYRTKTSRPVQFLMTYLFDGETFRPAARTSLTARNAEVDPDGIAIADGAILVELRRFEPGDQDCCPSGRRQARFVIDDGELVETTGALGAEATRPRSES